MEDLRGVEIFGKMVYLVQVRSGLYMKNVHM